jgi:hypothetical protein
LSKPKILVFDIETAPLLGYVWGLWDQTVALNQIHKDWHLLSWAAKWLGEPASSVMYADQRKSRRIDDDRKLVEALWKLLDEADAVITQNGRAFDQKKVNARFAFHGMQPPSSYKHFDTLLMAKKHFAFTSNKLEYLTDKLCTKYKKLKPTKFPGFEMWRQCLAGNTEAWDEMKKYNIHDVLALEELYTKLIPWENTPTFSLYAGSPVCSCGNKKFQKRGFYYTNTGKFQRYRCEKCGSETRDRTNLFDADQRKAARTGVAR